MLGKSVVAFIVCLYLAVNVDADQFPNGPGDPTCPDDFATGAMFKIMALDGTIVNSGLLTDANTIVGRSDPHREDSPADSGATICAAAATPYPDTLLIVGDACRRPANWPESDDTRREVHTEILSLNLTDGSITIKAGQDYFDSVQGTPQERFFKHSVGEVSSNYGGTPVDYSQDFPARSFFNIYVEVDVPALGMKLYNKTPMIVEAQITQFPPDLNLPEALYIHDPSFSVPLFDQDGLPWGWLLSAGHGAESGDGFPSNPPDASLLLNGPVSFSVDDASLGLDSAVTMILPDNVFDDQGMSVQQVTTYLSSGATPGASPDMSNARDVVGSFAAGDAINSLSYGRDGTVSLMPPDPLCSPRLGALHFSVSRTSLGINCSDVYLNAGEPLLTMKEAAADVYVSGVSGFGRYGSAVAAVAPLGDNLLVADSTHLGLRPLLTDAGDDNMTGLELDVFTSAGPNRDFLFGTFTGPSFGGGGATIYVYDPAAGPFNLGNLAVYAVAADLGLQAGDVIDALILADYESSSACPPDVNGALDPGVDEVLFSLAPGSPSLIGGRSAADVFYSAFAGTFTLFASHSDLGLLPADDIDALDIRSTPSDIPAVSTWGLIIMALVTLTAGTVVFSGWRRLAAAQGL